MAKTRKEIVAGFVALLLLAVGFYYAHMKSARDAEAGYRVTASFSRIDGLPRNADVRLSGVIVGRVEKETFGNDLFPLLTLRIDQDITLPADSSASIQTDGLFGNKYISLEPGGDSEIIPTTGEIIYTEKSMIVSHLLDQIIAQGHTLRRERDAEINRLRMITSDENIDDSPQSSSPSNQTKNP